MSAPQHGKVGIIGSGLIGRSWAMLFVGAGYKVCLFDVSMDQLKSAHVEIGKQLEELEAKKLLRGTLKPAEQLANISITSDISECMRGAFYIQECIWEKLESKKEIFATIDQHAQPEQILASSTSTIPGSKFSADMKLKNRFIVAHPVNPPFYCPLVELVPTPWTDKDVIDVAYEVMKKIGQSPIKIKKEVAGFVLNRIQYALLAECWRMVADGVADVEDIDIAMRDGLGPRYAFLGALELTHLNAEGVEEYSHKYNAGYMNVCSTFGPTPNWEEPALLDVVKKQCEAKVPMDKLAERRRWRDVRLAELALLKKRLDEDDKKHKE
jgi:L-gulonate 3-dehydrogenase